jgi:hypothetical protein
MQDALTGWTDSPGREIAESLERGAVVHYATCPFGLPNNPDLQFLLTQRLAGRAHKNVGYDPRIGKVTGYAREGTGQKERLQAIFAGFSADVTRWAAATLPHYARHWRLDRVSYRPEEEATRKLRRSARNDLLHVDAFPSRPTNGWRILRIFVNLNPTADRVWVTSYPFAELLSRYGREAVLPGAESATWSRRIAERLLSLLRPGHAHRSAYDAFMLRFHNWLKASDEFQKNTPKRTWHFQPGSAWMVITDTASHAVLGGRFALEHSYFLSPQSLALPDESPAALLSRACGMETVDRAA